MSQPDSTTVLPTSEKKSDSFWLRTGVSLVLLPVGIVFFLVGGVWYAALIALILVLAAHEFVKLYEAGGYQPASLLVLGGVFLLAWGRYLSEFNSAAWSITLLILLAMAYHLIQFERGRDQAATDFAISLAGIFYLGWIGSYLISVRFLPQGEWWLFIILPSVWAADSGAYLVGSRFGRHKLSPRLSPKKTWEGYWGGLIFGLIFGPLFALAVSPWTGASFQTAVWQGALVGLLMGLLTPLGDLGESMIKRQVHAKDSGTLIPGHGGVFDRIDSWLWAVVIGYYVILWVF